jgi:hypothetical protein
MIFKPNAGHGDRQMRIVGKERFAGVRFRSIHHPVVASTTDANGRQKFLRRAKLFEHRIGNVAEHFGGHNGWVHRRIIVFQFRRLVRAEFADECRAQQFHIEIGGQAPAHILGKDERVQGLPRFGGVSQNGELERQTIFVLRDERIHTARVRFQNMARLIAQMAQIIFGGARQADRAQQTIGVERDRTKDFCEFAMRQPAIQLHLPQAILRVNVPLRENEIVLILRVKVRHAPFIAQHLDRRLQTGETQDAACLRQWATIQVRDTDTKRNNNGGNKPR